MVACILRFILGGVLIGIVLGMIINSPEELEADDDGD